MLLGDQSGRVEATVAQAADESAERVESVEAVGGSQGREQKDKGESRARRVKEFQASEYILFRFPPKSHSCQGSDRCCD